MNRISNALIWFIVSFIVFHIILYIMWGEKQEYWYLYTGIMLIAGISYIFYQRDIESKRLLTSLGIGIITGTCYYCAIFSGYLIRYSVYSTD